MPEISVIICAYNAEKYIEKAVLSLMNQTFRDFEVIIINDGSTDSTLSVCSRLAMTDRRIVTVDIENGGMSHARNVGMKMARGRFIAFCDADDTVDSDALRTMYDIAVRDGTDMVICGYFHDIEVGGNVVESTEMSAGNAVFMTKEQLMSKFIELKSKFIFDSSCNKLFYRSIIEQNGLKMPEGELFEDTAFVLSYLSVSCRVSLTDKCFYHYFQRSGKSITKSYNPRRLNDLIKRYDDLCVFCKDAPEAVQEYCRMYFVRTVYSCLSALFGDNFCQKKERNVKIRAAVSSDDFKKAAKTAVAGGFSDRLTLLIARCRCSFLNILYCRAVFFMKHRAQRIFTRIK